MLSSFGTVTQTFCFVRQQFFNFSASQGAAEIGGVFVILGSGVLGSIDPPFAIIDLDG
jgi:hypothetical protein